jgi:hypothetical protein
MGERGQVRLSDPNVRAELEKAGASTLGDPNQPVLRCATLEAAERTIEHLESVLPGVKWRIIEEVFAEERLGTD